jgi:uncharacterized SAM-binding protein YcdF (DUF218 family)
MSFTYLEVLAKRAIGDALMPFPIFLESLCVAVILAWLPGKRKAAKYVCTIATAFLLITSNYSFSNYLIRSLETTYPALPEYVQTENVPKALRDCHFIAVLGSGSNNFSNRSAIDELSPSGLARLAEAARIARLLPQAKLIFSGTTPEDSLPYARVMRHAAISLGVCPERISLIEGVRDTEDEILELRSRLLGQRFILITSAWHMPRAMGLCRKQGLNPIPVPTDFIEGANDPRFAQRFVWNCGSMERSSIAIHERLGLLWSWLLGQR